MSLWDDQNQKEVDEWLSKKTPEERRIIAEQVREEMGEYFKNFDRLIGEVKNGQIAI